MDLKNAILQASDLKVKEIEVPEWHLSIFIRTFSGRVRDAVDKFIASKIDTKTGALTDPTGIRSFVLVHSLCDEKGRLIFSIDDIPDLEEKDAGVLQSLFEQAQELNGMSETVEEGKKN